MGRKHKKTWRAKSLNASSLCDACARGRHGRHIPTVVFAGTRYTCECDNAKCTTTKKTTEGS